MKYKGLVIFSILCIFTLGCPAKTPPTMTSRSGGEVVIDADQNGGAPLPDVSPANTVVQPPPPPSRGDVPDGLVRVVVTIPEQYGKIRYAITDVGFQPIYPAADGKVYIDLTPNEHQINVVTLEWKWAVEKNQAFFPVYCNGIRLTRVRPDSNGGMYYFFIYPQGQIGTDPP